MAFELDPAMARSVARHIVSPDVGSCHAVPGGYPYHASGGRSALGYKAALTSSIAMRKRQLSPAIGENSGACTRSAQRGRGRVNQKGLARIR